MSIDSGGTPMRRLWRLLVPLCGVIAVAAAPNPASAAGTVHYVSPNPLASTLFDLSCDQPGFNSINAAVGASATGDTIIVCDGVYYEDVRIAKSLSLYGSGNSVIQAVTATNQDDVVTVEGGATVIMSGFIVRGPGSSTCGSIGAGIRVRENATLDVSYTTIRDIADQGNSGCQDGEGIRVGLRQGMGEPGHLIADNVVVTDYQKNGITVSGTGSTAKITNTTVTGRGPISYIAQNGIQVSSGAKATISTSTIRDNYYVPKPVVACGLLIIDADGVNDDTNVYLANEEDKCTVNGRGGTYEGAP